MSQNQDYQNNIEHRCLNLVKNSMVEEKTFGLSRQEFIELQKWLKDAKPNPISNNFPDFIFKEGFIEHFAITSSQEDKKGAKQKRESSVFKKNSESSFLSNLDSSEENILVSQSFAKPFVEHSHYNLVNSIKKNWIKHMSSYEKSVSHNKIGIFLLEYIDLNIETAVLRENEPVEVFETYRLSLDKDLLNWMYTFKEKIQYLILINSLSLEVIKIGSIPDIIKEIPYVIYAPTVCLWQTKNVGYGTPFMHGP